MKFKLDKVVELTAIHQDKTWKEKPTWSGLPGVWGEAADTDGDTKVPGNGIALGEPLVDLISYNLSSLFFVSWRDTI